MTSGRHWLFVDSRRSCGAIAFLCALALTAGDATAQSSSLLGTPGVRDRLTLESTSFTYVVQEPPREIQLHDIITVVIIENSEVFSEGKVNRRKQEQFDAALQDWILLRDLNLVPDPQSKGDPRIRGYVNSRYRAQNTLETRDGLKGRVAAEVVDIRPNGNLVLEAHRRVKNNNEIWEMSLTGIVRGDRVLPDGTVRSEYIHELQIDKQEAGQVRDSYRRGWLLRFLDRYHPF